MQGFIAIAITVSFTVESLCRLVRQKLQRALLKRRSFKLSVSKKVQKLKKALFKN